jgi:hypothetical protein
LGMTRGRFVATRRANALDDVWLATIKSHSAVLPVAVFLHAVRTEDTLERPPAHREIGRVGDAPGICCREIRF